MHKIIRLLLITSKPPNFIYNRRQNFKTYSTKLGQGKNEHLFLPTFQVRPLCIPFLTPNIITCVLFFRLFFFLGLLPVLTEATWPMYLGMGVRAGEVKSCQPYSFFPWLDNNLNLLIVSEFCKATEILWQRLVNCHKCRKHNCWFIMALNMFCHCTL